MTRWLGLLLVLAADSGASPVVARLGPTVVTVKDVEEGLAALAPFQRAAFGPTTEAARLGFLNEVVVRDELLALGAETNHLGRQQPTAYQIERALSSATIRALRARLGPAADIPLDQVERYYAENSARYNAPERYQIWRILCKTREEAQSVLDAAARDPTPATFSALARDHSLDKGTNLRAGNLGFITADGSSSEPGLRVEQTVVRAAQSVRDGELAPAPVPEGDYYSVVWRRGTIAPTRRTLAEAAAQIRDTLWKARVKEETDKLVATLRASRLHAVNASLVDTIPSVPNEKSVVH